MSNSVNTIVIVGGGTAGWLTAGLLAAEHNCAQRSDLRVIVVESPDVGPIGVGEGTWPTMRATLETIGISETDFVRRCESSFKQGTRFSGWLRGGDEYYYHPFAMPPRFHEVDLARHWQPIRDEVSYADAVTPQARVCERGLAPKQISTPEFASHLNYGYHLDAGQFSEIIQEHCTENLGVTRILANVVAVNSGDSGDISSLSLQSGELLAGDLFVDCTGFAALLLGDHYGIEFVDKHDVLFNDSALAAQVPRDAASESIASATHASAQDAGWIWDIALPSRRGIGHVYSSRHTDDSRAEEALFAYVRDTAGEAEARKLSPRKISFNPGHRARLWHKNCVAIGLSAGFVEPLEASALVMIELSAKMLSEQLPGDREVMPVVAKRFNDRFLYHWNRIVEFLKLHYVLSERTDSRYWQDNRDPQSIPADLQGSLQLWRHQSPRYQDLPLADELFPAASYRYVLYGMQYVSSGPDEHRRSDRKTAPEARKLFLENAKLTKQAIAALPPNRELIDKVREFGFQRI